jgi:hypothetical protein
MLEASAALVQFVVRTGAVRPVPNKGAIEGMGETATVRVFVALALRLFGGRPKGFSPQISAMLSDAELQLILKEEILEARVGDRTHLRPFEISK